MTDADFLDQLGPWALGGLDAEAARAMERHLEEQPELAEATRRAFTVAAALGAALPPSPPAEDVWPRLVARLRLADAARANRPGSIRRAKSRQRRLAAAAWGAAALAAVVAVWLWLDRRALLAREATLARDLKARDEELASQRDRRDSTLASRSQIDQCVRELEALRQRDRLAAEAVALLELAGTQLVPLEPRAPAVDGRGAPAANAIYHRGVKKAFVVVQGLPPDSAGYSVWVVRGKERVHAADIEASREGTFIASVSTASLGNVPESFEIARGDGTLVLQSRIKI